MARVWTIQVFNQVVILHLDFHDDLSTIVEYALGDAKLFLLFEMKGVH